ncbi:MAG: proline--tRNA ligase, partial [Eubacterium sp.]|nr:proline--tRNA ligase [Eubacterium sp.]
RSREFLWQEGHTLHATAEEAIEETERMLGVYTKFCQESLAIPVVQGQKTESDKFAGAERTYCIEALMHDGKALQAGTSHYFGDGFARAFEIQYSNKDNQLTYPHQTSWGMTTRLIGAIIMTHGDDNGLVLPPAVAPIQAIVIPVAQHKEGVLEKANELRNRLAKVCRAKIDDSDNSPGWKFAEYEMKGVPVRVEIGPKDIENNQCVIVTRHNREKTFVSLDNIEEEILKKLEEVRQGIYQSALENRERRTYIAKTLDDITEQLEKNGDGFIKAMWCGDEECEDKVKEITGVGSRCIPFEQEQLSDKCVCCGKPARHMLYWGKAY